MKELIEYIAKSLVDDPDAVVVKEKKKNDDSIVYELHVAPDDVGRVIGKGGRVANAMRTLLRVSAIKEGKKASLEIE